MYEEATHHVCVCVCRPHLHVFDPKSLIAQTYMLMLTKVHMLLWTVGAVNKEKECITYFLLLISNAVCYVNFFFTLPVRLSS